MLTRYLTTTGMPRYENLPEQFRRKITADPSQKEITRQDTMNWEDVRKLRDLWPRRADGQGHHAAPTRRCAPWNTAPMR